MSKYVLKHGIIVELSDDQLMHWKYIKREKKNGKWVYYYDESELNKAKKAAKDAERQHVTDAAKLGVATYELDDAKAKYAGFMTERSKSDDKKYTDAINKYEKAAERAQTSAKKAQEAEKKYQTKKITSFAARTISKGLVKIANLLSGSSKKKKKKK